MTETKLPRVLFYTNTPRAFQTTLIGILYEVSRDFSVTLLSEEMDNETSSLLRDKELFPNLDEIIPVHQHTGPRTPLLRKYRYLFNLAKEVVSERVDIVVASSDWHSVFEMYLMRFAKNFGLLRVTAQDTFTGVTTETSRWVDAINLYEKTPSGLPLWLRRLIIRARKYAGYCLYHFLLPLTVRQFPFFTLYSYLLLRGCSGCGDSEYHVVWSQRDFAVHEINGVPASKLRVMAHPINRNAKAVFDRLIKSVGTESDNEQAKKLVIMLPAMEIGIRRIGDGLITKDERRVMYLRVLQIIRDTLPDYWVVVKPHPAVTNFEERRLFFLNISDQIHFCNPSEPASKWIQAADIIMELPRAASTTLLTATLQCPDKPILALDFQNELLGDVYKNFPGIEYLESEDSLAKVLRAIRDGTYEKKNCAIDNSGHPVYGTFASLLRELYAQQL